MIRIVILDIDGVITDGKVTFDASGNEFKTVDYKDIDAVFEMRRTGLIIGMITGEASPITECFSQRFKPDYFYSGCKDKIEALNRIMEKTGVKPDEICYVGDGKYDVPVMKHVKFAACPADAIPEVKKEASVILESRGGQGCIWELMLWILAKNKNET